MKIGLSYSRCVLDIVDGTVDIDDVLLIIARTDFDPHDDEQWKGIWEGYGGGQDLAMAWHLPISVVSAIRYHECNWRNELPSISSNHLQTLFVVSTANILALNHGPRPIGFPAVQELRKDLFEGFYIDEGVMKNAVRESLEFLEQVR